MYNQPNAITCLKCKVELLFIYNSNGNVSLELVYVGWDFGDHHYDNSRAIIIVIDQISFKIISCCLFCTLSFFCLFVFVSFLTPFQCFFLGLYISCCELI
jgi:hypothetical protein